MTIKVECGDCGQTYNMKDEMEGKKIRCKECSVVICVSAEDEDWDEEIEKNLQPPVRKSSTNKKKAKGRSSSNGMPLFVRLGLICVGLMVVVSMIDLVGIITLFAKFPAGNSVLVGLAVWILLRIGIQLRVFFGVLDGTASTRFTSIVLAVMAALAIGAQLAAGGELLKDSPEYSKQLLFQSILLCVVLIGCMLVPSTGNHMRH